MNSQFKKTVSLLPPRRRIFLSFYWCVFIANLSGLEIDATRSNHPVEIEQVVMSYFRRDDEALLAAALTGFT